MGRKRYTFEGQCEYDTRFQIIANSGGMERIYSWTSARSRNFWSLSRSISTNAQFSHDFFTGSARALLNHAQYELQGSLRLQQQAYDSTMLAQWLPEPEMQPADLKYSIQGSFEAGTLAYDLGARKE